MSNSDYQAQVSLNELSGRRGQKNWADKNGRRMRDRGATWLRFSLVHQYNLLVAEGWKERPENEGEVTVNLVPVTKQ